jgi:hypothetical protein
MVKQTTQKNVKKTTAKQPTKGSFQRWLVPGLLTITLYLFTIVLGNLSIKSNDSVTMTNGTIVSILLIGAIASAIWWLIETARWIITYIDVRAAKPAVKKK